MDAPPVQYVTTSDGYDIAYAVCGSGPPIMVLPGAFEHVQLAWEYPVLGSWLRALAARFTAVQLDLRGAGMSSRNLGPDFKFDHFQRDVEAVVDRVKLDHVIIWAATAMCSVAARYAVDNPNKVTALILSSPANRPRSPAFFSEVSEQDWEQFLYGIVPRNRSPEEAKMQVNLLKQSFDSAGFGRRFRAAAGVDMAELFARTVTPTLVLHARDYAMIEATEAMHVAQLARASLALIDGSYVFGDPDQGVRAIEGFLSRLNQDAQGASSAGGLSPRETEVLHLLAGGKSNQQIADELVISLNTVNRHVSNIYAKIGAANRAEAATYAAQHGIA